MNGYVTRSGPLFDQRAGEVMTAFILDADREIADEAADVTRYYGQGSFRYLSSAPTGNWRRSVNVRRSFGSFVVRSDIVYGGWLEGVSRRNAATRFKGYAMFRRAAQTVGARAHLIAQRVLPLYLRQLGGR